MKLTNEPEEIPAIAKRIGADEKELAETLEAMAQKGIIYRVRSGDKKLYQAFQFIVGVYEFQLKRLDKEFCELFEQYLPYLGMNMASLQTSQLRVVPVLGLHRNAIERKPEDVDCRKGADKSESVGKGMSNRINGTVMISAFPDDGIRMADWFLIRRFEKCC